MFEAAATDEPDGWRVISLALASGRWFRVENGAAHIQLGDPGFEAMPSLQSARVSGERQVLRLADAKDFVDGEHVALYGGGEAATLARPTMPDPVLMGVSGATTRQYCCAAVDNRLAVSQASPIVTVHNGPDELDHDNYYVLIFARQIVDPATGVRITCMPTRRKPRAPGTSATATPAQRGDQPG